MTPLCKCLFEDMSNIFKSQENSKYLMVETNFKVYAYTSNEFELKIINMLFDVEYSFKGFVVAHITRNSIRKALKRGVTHHRVNDSLMLRS